jgi:hypothetical protein
VSLGEAILVPRTSAKGLTRPGRACAAAVYAIRRVGAPSAPTRTSFLHRALRWAASSLRRSKYRTRSPGAAVPGPLLSWLLQQLQQFLAGFGFELLGIEGTIVVGISSFELGFDEIEVLILRECALRLPKPKATLLQLLIK